MDGGATRDRGSGLPAADVRGSPPRLFPATRHFEPLASSGGATRDRTADLLNANQALSQLSYSPKGVGLYKKFKNN